MEGINGRCKGPEAGKSVACYCHTGVPGVFGAKRQGYARRWEMRLKVAGMSSGRTLKAGGCHLNLGGGLSPSRALSCR